MIEFHYQKYHSFTMVKNIIEFWPSKTVQNDSIYHPYSIPSPWFKEILKFDLPEASILVQFYYLTYIHSFTMVEENFEICPSEIVQNDSMYHQHLFTIMFVITL